MYSKILVPLDGSVQAEHAVDAAGRIARASGGSVVLMQVLNAAGELLPYVVPGFEPSTLGADLQGASNYLTALTTLPALQGIPVEVEAHTGLAPTTILQLARAQGVDLIVLSHAPHTTMRQWTLGSVSFKVASHAEVPVFLLPEMGRHFAPPAAEAPQGVRVLVPLDGSRMAEVALGPAIEFATLLSGQARGHIHLLHVFDATDREGNVPATARTWAEQYLAQMAEQVRATQPNPPEVTASTVTGSGQDVAALVNGLASGLTPEGMPSLGSETTPAAADVIALATRGRGGFQPWSAGSVADRLIRGATMPLLVAHPRAE